MSGCPGLLELLHPDGVAQRAEVLGSACPERLRPARPGSAPPWDLVVLAPSADEAHSREWVDGAVAGIARSLAQDAVLYALIPPRSRGAMTRALTRAGVLPVLRLLHQPDAATSELLIPVHRSAIRRTADLLLPRGSSRRRGVGLALSVPGAVTLLGRGHPAVGIVARRPGSRPLAAWMDRTSGLDAAELALVQTRWRTDRTRTVLHLMPQATRRPPVAKVALRGPDAPAELRREAEALALLGPAARSAGIAVPSGALVELAPDCPALVLESVPGSSAARALNRHPDRADRVLHGLGTWLEQWSRATCHARVVDRALLDRWVLGPAARLAEPLAVGSDYLEWLEGCCRALLGQTVPLVASHNDLTMANVLLLEGGGLGVVDWEAATPQGLPLRDFVYAAVDATAAVHGYRDRPAAWDECFGPGSVHASVHQILSRLRQAVAVPDEFATVAFHACWLQHAEDERKKRTAGEPRPFLECARRAANRRWQA